MSLKRTNFSEKEIYSYLYNVIKNHYGVSGLLGNIKAESNLRPENLQNTYERSLGLKDDEYVEKVDNGTYTNFIKDKAGFGLAQWTYWSRKESFLNYCKSKNASIGCCETQLEFLIKELDGYKLLNDLKNSKSVRESSDLILLKFEKPADQSENVKIKRAKLGEEFFERYSSKIEPQNKKVCSNSSLVNYVLISPNKTVMTDKVNKKITIHHMAGNLTVERCGQVFQQTSRKASSNYGLSTDGRVGLYVEEKDRAWTSSSKANDSESITIEVANDIVGGNWHVSDKAYNKLIELCVDICKRNNIEKLIWTGDKNGTLTCHYMFSATACPGPYLKSKMPEIASEVNKRLNSDYKEPILEDKEIIYIVQKGDTLAKIASKYNTTYQHLQKINNISNPNLIRTGQQLKINIKEEAAKTESYYTYDVKIGDSLWSIAKRELGDGNRYRDIMNWNNLKQTVIKEGMKLKIYK